MGDNKIIIGILIVSALILGGAIILLGGSSGKASLEKVAGAKLELTESDFDFKDIPYSGGDVVHEFKIKNIGDKELKIANLKTSCTCTKVLFETQSEKSPFFSMHSQSDWTGKLNPGEEGIIISSFDPTAHGPSGVGPIERIISFESNDPDHPYIELSFRGNVVK